MIRVKNKEEKRFLFFGLLALLFIIFCILAPEFTPHDPYETNVLLARQAPSPEYPFGTDRFGRCVLSRVMAGGRISVSASLLLVLVTSVFGTFIGVISAYYEGRVDAIIMRITDVFLAFPNMILAIAVAGFFGGSLLNAMAALMVSGWTVYARLARSSTLSLKHSTFVQAAVLSGISDAKIMFHHILPNITGILIVTATLNISSMMMGIAGLSFLNLGVQVPQAEWGALVSEGKDFLQTAPWIAVFPSLVLIMAMIIFNLAGDSLRDLMGTENRND